MVWRRQRDDHADAGLEAAYGHEQTAREQYGGMKFGAAFFGWLVAVAVTVLLTGIIGAIAAAVGVRSEVAQSDAERAAGTIGLGAAIVLVAVFLVGYYAGGYVAGRMSRFDGGKQGFLVWLIGTLVTVLAVLAGMIFGPEYNVLDRVTLPRMPTPTDEFTVVALVTAAAIMIGTLVVAMVGGRVGHRYHDKVDRAANLSTRMLRRDG